MSVWIVRHGCAGDKHEWAGPDALRPLDEVGHQQAIALAELLAAQGPKRLVSSPAVRCLETLRPLSWLTDLPVVVSANLQEEAEISAIVEVIGEQPAGSVICTHGEVMTPLLTVLRAVGVDVDEGNDETLLRKGIAWRFNRSAMALRSCVPPDLVDCGLRHDELAGAQPLRR